MGKYKCIVNDYIRKWRPTAKAEMLSFVKEPTLEAAITRAALCNLSNGKRHSHQYRIPSTSLNESKSRLLHAKSKLKNCTSFDELYDLVNGLIRDIWMIGELTVYDTTTRIGAYLHIEPMSVYLHSGTREGAVALGFNPKAPKLHLEDLPREFRDLKPSEIEDCLCLYKDWLSGNRSLKSRGCLSIKRHSTRMR